MWRLLDYLKDSGLDYKDVIDQKHIETIHKRPTTPCQNKSRKVEDAITAIWKSRNLFLQIFNPINEVPPIITQLVIRQSYQAVSYLPDR
jgi:hypothetical protein